MRECENAGMRECENGSYAFWYFFLPCRVFYFLSHLSFFPMKQLITFLSAFLLFVNLGRSQVAITVAPDFTVTDIHGEQHHLYSLLDEGKYVMIDLYAYWCGPCCQTAPEIKKVYEDYGCNTGDLFVIGLEADGTIEQCETFETNCGSAGGHPVASGLQGSGSEAVDAFAPLAFPTIILVAPDRSIIQQDIWPFSSAVADNILSQLELEKMECGTVSGQSSLAPEFFGQVKVSPNPFRSRFLLDFEMEESAPLQLQVTNALGQVVLQRNEGAHTAGRQQLWVEAEALPNGLYFIQIKAGDKISRAMRITKS